MTNIRWRPRLLFVLCSCLLFLSSFTVEVSASNLSPGVVYKQNKATRILEIDTTDPFTEVQLGRGEQLNHLTTVLNRAKSFDKSGNKIVGAINANFYQLGERIPSHLVAHHDRLIYKGHVWTNDANQFVNKPIGFGMTKNGKASIGTYEVDLTYTYKGKDYTITNTNKPGQNNNTIVYTPNHYQATTGTEKRSDVTEVVVETGNNPVLQFGTTYKGKVKSVRQVGEKKATSIPKNGFVLTGHGTAATRLGKVQVGEEIELAAHIDSKWRGADFVMAAGPQLVKNGVVGLSMNENSWNAKAKAARTAVGIDRTGTKVFFVTIDGDKDTGVDLKQLAETMKRLGAYHALNLDGGGSTTMVTRPNLSSALRLVNDPSDGRERSISSILMAADTEPKRIFPDVGYRHEHFPGIDWLRGKGITGYADGTYGPYDKLTRQQSAVMFTKSLSLQEPDHKVVTTLFTDIPEAHEYARQIAAVGQAGIFKGANGRFSPYKPMTREQMATTLVQAYDLQPKAISVPVELGNVSPSHKENVQILADHGITVELGNFRPGEQVTRGQFATFLYKASLAQ